MVFEHLVITPLLISVVPEYKLDLVRYLCYDVVGYDGIYVVVIVVLGAYAEVHIAPHHRSESVLVRNFYKALHIFVKYGERRHISVFVKEFSAAHIVRFVHSDVYALRTECRGCGRNKLFEKFKGLFISCEQNLSRVLYPACLGPMKVSLHVSVALDAWDHLDSVSVCIVIKLAKLLDRIFSAHISKERTALECDKILGVEHSHIISHEREMIEHFFSPAKGQHLAAGYVYHRGKRTKMSILEDLKGIAFCGIFAEYAQSAEKVSIFVIVYDRLAAREGDSDPVGGFGSYGDAVARLEAENVF